MNKTEISRRLALAIGYPADRVIVLDDSLLGSEFVYVLNDFRTRTDGPMPYRGWQRFDHTDSDVFRHVAERFKAFPRSSQLHKDKWFAFCFPEGNGVHHVNPATASALAVIQYVESKA